jgi:hypothetical protein
MVTKVSEVKDIVKKRIVNPKAVFYTPASKPRMPEDYDKKE